MPLDGEAVMKEMVQDWPQISHSNRREPHFTSWLGSKLSVQGRTLDNQIALEHFLHYPDTRTPQQTFGLSLYLIVDFISLCYRPRSNLSGEICRKGEEKITTSVFSEIFILVFLVQLNSYCLYIPFTYYSSLCLRFLVLCLWSSVSLHYIILGVKLLEFKPKFYKLLTVTWGKLLNMPKPQFPCLSKETVNVPTSSGSQNSINQYMGALTTVPAKSKCSKTEVINTWWWQWGVGWQGSVQT